MLRLLAKTRHRIIPIDAGADTALVLEKELERIGRHNAAGRAVGRANAHPVYVLHLRQIPQRQVNRVNQKIVHP